MNLYLLKRPEDQVGSDENAGFVVRAHSESQARTICSNRSIAHGDEDHNIWLRDAACEEIGVAFPKDQHPDILLADFNAG